MENVDMKKKKTMQTYTLCNQIEKLIMLSHEFYLGNNDDKVINLCRLFDSCEEEDKEEAAASKQGSNQSLSNKIYLLCTPQFKVKALLSKHARSNDPKCYSPNPL